MRQNEGREALTLEIERLTKSRDDALHATGKALRDATRVTRLLIALNEPAPIGLYLDRILSAISELFLADIVILLDPAGSGDFEPIASVGLPEELNSRIFSGFEMADAFERLRSGVILDLGALRANPEVDAGMRSLGVEVAVWIPVMGSGESRGAMVLGRCGPDPFPLEEMGLLSAMAYRIGLALEQIEQRTQLERLARGSRELARHMDARSITEEAVQFFAGLMKAEAAGLFAEGPGGDVVCEGFSIQPMPGNPGALASTRLFSSNRDSDADAVLCSVETAETSAIAEALGLPCKAILAAPISAMNMPRKWLVAIRTALIDFDLGSREIAYLYSRQLGVVLENARLYGTLQEELGELSRAEAALRDNETMLRSRQDELQRMVELRDRLFSIIGHDLRGPVGAICDLLRLLQEDSKSLSSENRDSVLAEILQSGESIYLLLMNLMDWGKTQTAAVELRPQTLDLRPCVDEVFALLAGQALAKGVELLNRAAPGLRLRADQGCLQTILRNLISNAVKFTSRSGRVSVSAEAEADMVRVRVADTGVGMDEAALASALDFSSRRSSRGTQGEKGLGLGLLLCKELAEKNGGSIGIESEPGVGTVASLLLKSAEGDGRGPVKP